MRSTFYGLDIANKGLFVAQRQIDVTAHNVSNANTDGYSRQRFVLAAVDPNSPYAQFAPMTQGAVGGGVKTKTLDQIRDLFLDRQYRTENTKTQYWETQSDALYYVEDIFNSIDENSLDGIMSSFFNSIQEFSKNTTDKAIRTNVVQNALKMTDVMHMYANQLSDLMYQQDIEVKGQVKICNEYLDQIAGLNENIFKYELGGQVANDLRDKRNLLLDSLSGMMNITYEEVGFDPPKYNMNGVELAQMQIYAGSMSGEDYRDNLLVSYNESYHLFTEQDVDDNYIVQGINDGAGPEEDQFLHSIYLSGPNGANKKFERYDGSSGVEGLDGGSMLGYLNMRDGEDADNQGIPYFLKQIDIFVSAFVKEFNEVHSAGYTMPSNGNASLTGINFFNPDKTSARFFSISEEVLADPYNIAGSSTDVTMTDSSHLNTGNNLIALEIIAKVKESTNIDGIGNFEGYFRSFLGALASQVGQTNKRTQSQFVLVDSLEAERVSVSGVSVDEEMTNMIRFQHAYNASARTITAMDEALDVLINRTGRVGL